MASVLYNISAFYQENMIAFNLENRKTSLNFNLSTKSQVFRKLILTENYLPFQANSFKAYFEKQKSPLLLQKKALKIERQMNKKEYPKFDASYESVNVYLILEKVLKTMKFPCLLSNKINDNITLHLTDSNSFEVLAYIMDASDLIFLRQDDSCMIKPRSL